jgi:hypothetical protein
MRPSESLFPARGEWPPASEDVATIPASASRVRLVQGAKNLSHLPRLTNLKKLWCFGIDEPGLAFIARCTSLESLHIETIKGSRLDMLGALAQLKVLSLETCPSVTDLEQLGDLSRLEGLALIHFKNVHDLGPLATLSMLRALAVSGSMWTRMRVNSFEPLRGLSALRFLQLANIKSDDERLDPIGALIGLDRLDLANFYPMAEFAHLSKKLSGTTGAWLRPYESFPLPCKTCGNASMVMLTGKRKGTLCTHCDAARLQKHLRDWNAASA